MTSTIPPPPAPPKEPPAWARWEYNGLFRHHVDGVMTVAHVWQRGRIRVLSSAVWADFRGVPQWHFLISVSAGGGYPTDDELARARKDFGMQPADEDNHESGAGVRKLFLPMAWRPGDPSTCECKTTEQSVVEPSGYTWQTEHGADLEAKRIEQAAIHRAQRILLRSAARR